MTDNVGQRDRYIAIEKPATEEDAAGTPVPTWPEFARAWARRLDVTGREQIRAGQLLSARTAIFTLPWLDGVTPQMRIREIETGQVWAIAAPPAELGRRERLEITATAEVS